MKKFFAALFVALAMVFGIKVMGPEVALAETAVKTADEAAQDDMALAKTVLGWAIELTHADPDDDLEVIWTDISSRDGMTVVKMIVRSNDEIMWSENEYSHEDLMEVYLELVAAKGYAALGMI